MDTDNSLKDETRSPFLEVLVLVLGLANTKTKTFNNGLERP